MVSWWEMFFSTYHNYLIITSIVELDFLIFLMAYYPKSMLKLQPFFNFYAPIFPFASLLQLWISDLIPFSMSEWYLILICTADRYILHKQWANRSTSMIMPIAGQGKGGGVLDKPVIEKTTPGRESEFDLRYGTYRNWNVWQVVLCFCSVCICLGRVNLK